MLYSQTEAHWPANRSDHDETAQALDVGKGLLIGVVTGAAVWAVVIVLVVLVVWAW